MIDPVQPINNPINTISASQEIKRGIQEALDLLEAVKKQDSKITSKRMKQLLIEYILANMRGDATETKAIQDQMSKLAQTYGQGIQHADGLETKLKAMDKNPGVNLSSDLTYLQSLIRALKQDVSSGDISNLYQYDTEYTPSTS